MPPGIQRDDLLKKARQVDTASQISDSRKSKRKIGRPKTTGSGQPQIVRMYDQQIAAIDAWIATVGMVISRPEAIRRLVEMALASKKKPPARYSEKVAAKARELASKAIDGLVDSSAPADEKAVRKRRLIKGPSAFRDVRVDQKR